MTTAIMKSCECDVPFCRKRKKEKEKEKKGDGLNSRRRKTVVTTSSSCFLPMFYWETLRQRDKLSSER